MHPPLPLLSLQQPSPSAAQQGEAPRTIPTLYAYLESLAKSRSFFCGYLSVPLYFFCPSWKMHILEAAGDGLHEGELGLPPPSLPHSTYPAPDWMVRGSCGRGQ